MRKFWSPWVSAFIFIAVESVSGFACTCPLIPSPCDEYRASATVFIGTVIKVSNLEGTTSEGKPVLVGGIARLKVNEIFKGELPEIVTFSQGTNGSCLPIFKKDQTWLIYADSETRESGVTLEPRQCSRNQLLRHASDDLAYLQKPADVAVTTKLTGNLKLEQKSQDSSEQASMLAGIRVNLSGKNSSYDALTDANGFFELAKLLPGKYTITLYLPTNLILLPGARNPEVVIVSSSCNYLNFALQLASREAVPKKPKD